MSKCDQELFVPKNFRFTSLSQIKPPRITAIHTIVLLFWIHILWLIMCCKTKRFMTGAEPKNSK